MGVGFQVTGFRFQVLGLKFRVSDRSHAIGNRQLLQSLDQDISLTRLARDCRRHILVLQHSTGRS